MNENNIQSSYYAIIPAYIRYNKELKFAERLLYGEITALSNKQGYCFASNRYFANLYDVSISTISRWISHLAELNSLHIEVVRNDKKEIIERRIYVVDNPHMQNNQYPYVQKEQYPYTQNNQYPICKKSKDNNININKIDRLFNYIINKEQKIPSEYEKFIDGIFEILQKYDMLYTKEMIQSFQSKESIDKIKYIMYAMALLVKEGRSQQVSRLSREDFSKVYDNCKAKQIEYENTENEIEDFANYYYRSIINEMSKGNPLSFFGSKTENRQNEDEEVL
ncbi:MAG: helix-turn-helix domain-containing protein [Clostridia bacterium]|nr:helix-turn-helix domain-containing protein [Clostridia bacterium]